MPEINPSERAPGRIPPRPSPETAQRGSEMLENAHAKALETLRRREYSIDPNSFRNYTKEEIRKDNELAESLRAQFEAEYTPQEREAKKLSDIFEAIVLSEGQESEWFGENTKLLKTAAYDDYKNHTDMVAELSNPGRDSRLLALAVDVTFSPHSLEKKLKRIKNDIDEERLGRLKYVHKEHAGVPRVVIGISRETVEELMELWLDEDNESLRRHPVQKLLLEEMALQLKQLALYAQGRGSGRIADAYSDSLKTIRSLLMQKRDVAGGTGDRVYAELQKKMRELFG